MATTNNVQRENNEKLTGPSRGFIGVGSVLVLTALTWLFLWTLHVNMWHDPMNPLSPNEKPTTIEAPHQQQPQ